MIIVSFGQVVDMLQGGQMVNQLTLELFTGERVSVTTDENTVQQLLAIAARLSNGGAARPSQVTGPPPQRWAPEVEQGGFPQHTEAAEEMASVFGGEADPGEQSEPVMGKMAEETMEVAPVSKGLGSGTPAPIRRPMVDKDGFALPIPSRTVEKDEMGYPVIRGSSAPAPSGDDGADDGTQI